MSTPTLSARRRIDVPYKVLNARGGRRLKDSLHCITFPDGVESFTAIYIDWGLRARATIGMTPQSKLKQPS